MRKDKHVTVILLVSGVGPSSRCSSCIWYLVSRWVRRFYDVRFCFLDSICSLVRETHSEFDEAFE